MNVSFAFLFDLGCYLLRLTLRKRVCLPGVNCSFVRSPEINQVLARVIVIVIRAAFFSDVKRAGGVTLSIMGTAKQDCSRDTMQVGESFSQYAYVAGRTNLAKKVL